MGAGRLHWVLHAPYLALLTQCFSVLGDRDIMAS